MLVYHYYWPNARLRNDLSSVEWEVQPYTLTHSVTYWPNAGVHVWRHLLDKGVKVATFLAHQVRVSTVDRAWSLDHWTTAVAVWQVRACDVISAY